MAITRTPMIDDDGTGTTGTIINNAWKQEFYNQIDAATGAQVSPWTPTDVSGAGLALVSPVGYFHLLGRLLHVWASFAFPATANASPATIGGFPVANSLGFTTGFFQTYGVSHSLHMPASSANMIFLHPTTFTQRTNADMSGQTIVFAGFYPIA